MKAARICLTAFVALVVTAPGCCTRVTRVVAGASQPARERTSTRLA